MPDEPQPILTPLTEAAIFLTMAVSPGGEDAVRDVVSDVTGLKRSVGFRLPEGELTCVVGIGARVWDRLFGAPAPGRTAPVQGAPRRAAHRPVDARGSAVSHPRAPPRPVLRARAAADGPAAAACARWSTRCTASGRSTSATCSGSWTGPRTPKGDAASDAVLIGDEDPALRGRQLRGGPEVPPRPRGVGRAVGRGAGTGDRPHEARGHRVSRRAQARQLAS